MANSTKTPEKTLASATDKNALAINRLTLVGTFEKTGGPTALIRTAAGDIRMVSAGDTIGASTVTAIEMGVLYLARGAWRHKLSLPEG